MAEAREEYGGKDVLILGGGDGALLCQLLKKGPRQVTIAGPPPADLGPPAGDHGGAGPRGDGRREGAHAQRVRGRPGHPGGAPPQDRGGGRPQVPRAAGSAGEEGSHRLAKCNFFTSDF